MNNPRLVQFGDLTAQDFESNHVWIASHTADDEEPWYDSTDEETFRPWSGDLPVDPADGCFLVRAEFTFPSGPPRLGFATPSPERDNIGAMQPHIFVADRSLNFWGGMVGVPRGARDEVYLLLQQTKETMFPIRFRADPRLTAGFCSGVLEGFYSSPDLVRVNVER